MKLVYLSGPITLGDLEQNLRQAKHMHLALVRRKFSVIDPILTALIENADSISHDDWVESDLPTIARVDAVLRLPGISLGADVEEAYARGLGIPVFRNVTDLLAWRDGQEDAA